MKISASIYSFKDKNLEALVEEMDDHNIDLFHVDCMDDIKVFDDIERIRRVSNTPIDLHVISSEPGKFLPLIEEHKIDYATFQFEDLKEKVDLPAFENTKWGLSIVSDTDIEVFEEYKDKASFVLMMCSVPGQSGLGFNKQNFDRIRKFARRYPGVKIHVDGGVTAEISFILRNMGVTAAVSGSYLNDSNYLGAALLNLKHDETHSHYQVKDFMIPLEETPVLGPEKHNLKEILNSIDSFNYGFTVLTDVNGLLQGIITNADIRKGLIRNIDDLNKIDVEKILNRNPVVASENMTVKELIKFIKQQKFPILYLPVVDEGNVVKGSMAFYNLIKGES